MFLCLQCAGVHRGFGVHIRYVFPEIIPDTISQLLQLCTFRVDGHLARGTNQAYAGTYIPGSTLFTRLILLQLGGNAPCKEFLKEYPAEGGWKDGMSPYDTYHSWAATQYREKVCFLSLPRHHISYITESSMPPWPGRTGRRQHRLLMRVPLSVHPVDLRPRKASGNREHRLATRQIAPRRRLTRHAPAHPIRRTARSLTRKPPTRTILLLSARRMRRVRTIFHHLKGANTKALVALPRRQHTHPMACHLLLCRLSRTYRRTLWLRWAKGGRYSPLP